MNVASLLALTYAHISGVVDSFDLLVDKFDEDADDFLSYFERTSEFITE